MNKKELLESMQQSIDTQDQSVFFSKMADAFTFLFKEIESIKSLINYDTAALTMAIKWDPAIALVMLKSVVLTLKHDATESGCPDAFDTELNKLKIAISENKITQSYDDFVFFWTRCLGYHPFFRHAQFYCM